MEKSWMRYCWAPVVLISERRLCQASLVLASRKPTNAAQKVASASFRQQYSKCVSKVFLWVDLVAVSHKCGCHRLFDGKSYISRDVIWVG